MNSVWLAVIPASIISHSVHLERTGPLCATVPTPLILYTSPSATRNSHCLEDGIISQKRACSWILHCCAAWWPPPGLVLKGVPVLNSSKLSYKGLQPWWACRKMGISTIRALAWPVLLLDHKFLRSLMTSCFDAVMMLHWSWWRCEWVALRSCHSRTCCVWGCESSSFWGLWAVCRFRAVLHSRLDPGSILS